jgi:hypothetical protein
LPKEQRKRKGFGGAPVFHLDRSLCALLPFPLPFSSVISGWDSSEHCPVSSKRLGVRLLLLAHQPLHPSNSNTFPPLFYPTHPTKPHSFTMDAFTAIFTPFVASAAETTSAPVAESRRSYQNNWGVFSCVIA